MAERGCARRQDGRSANLERVPNIPPPNGSAVPKREIRSSSGGCLRARQCRDIQASTSAPRSQDAPCRETDKSRRNLGEPSLRQPRSEARCDRAERALRDSDGTTLNVRDSHGGSKSAGDSTSSDPLPLVAKVLSLALTGGRHHRLQQNTTKKGISFQCCTLRDSAIRGTSTSHPSQYSHRHRGVALLRGQPL